MKLLTKLINDHASQTIGSIVSYGHVSIFQVPFLSLVSCSLMDKFRKYLLAF